MRNGNPILHLTYNILFFQECNAWFYAPNERLPRRLALIDTIEADTPEFHEVKEYVRMVTKDIKLFDEEANVIAFIELENRRVYR